MPPRSQAAAQQLREALALRGRGRRRLPLPGGAAAADVARQATAEVGCVWLDDAVADRHLIAVSPVATIGADPRGSWLDCGSGRERFDLAALDLAGAVCDDHGLRDRRLFGYLGYELMAEVETLPAFQPPAAPLPDLFMTIHDAWLELDAGHWYLVSAGNRSNVEIDRLIARVQPWLDATRPGARREWRAVDVAALVVEPDDARFEAAVQRTVDRIVAGEIFETNLCRRFRAPLDPRQAWEFYRRLRTASPAEYGAFLRLPEAAIASVSPECFLRAESGQIESLPIKGTRPRGLTPPADRAAAAELLASDKDAAELAMIVDLVRNDLGRVARAGTVRVAEHATLMELPTVWHTRSRIQASLRDEVGLAELLRATFPPGSITGAPKIQAVIVALAEEPHRRGPAMGAIGWIDSARELHLSVAIRTAVVAGNAVAYHAGGGIVADSVPAAERDETAAKARAFRMALGID